MLGNREQRLVEYMSNKTDFLLNRLKDHRLFMKYAFIKGITGDECKDVLGSSELRKMMSNIRRSVNYAVLDVWENGVNKFGEPNRYKRYFIVPKKIKKVIDIVSK